MGNIFNLHLMTELLSEADLSDLRAITYQVELLDRYWRHRLHKEPERRDAREQALEAVLACMIAGRVLRAERQDVYRKLPSADVSDLERIGILRSPTTRRAQAGEVLVFAHHVLFDYAVARVTLRRGRRPHLLIDMLVAEPDLALMFGPALALCLADAWLEQPPERPGFWRLASDLSMAEEVPEITKVQAPTAVAANAGSIDDLAPLLRLIDASGEGPVDLFVWHLAAALLMKIAAGVGIFGETGGPWAEFADRLSERVGLRTSVYALRTILWKLTEQPEDLTPEQFCHAGRAARRLLEAAWARSYDRGLVAASLEAVCDTFESDRQASAALIRRVLEPDHLRQHGFEEMPCLAHKIDRLILEDPDLAVEIYIVAFTHDEESTEANPLSRSVLLSLTSNRRQDYRHSWWELKEKFPEFLASHPVPATRALIGVIEGYVAREHASGKGRTSSLSISGLSARLREDASYIWAPWDREPYDDAERMLGAFSQYLRDLAGRENAGDTFLKILQTMAAENELAVLWAALIHAAADAPLHFAEPLAELLSAPPVLTWPDTSYAAARYLENAYALLSEAERTTIERTIVGLPHISDAEREIRLCVAGYLPKESIVTEDARELRREAEATNAARKSEPRSRIIRVSGSAPTLSEWLQEEGVDTESPANQHIIRLIEPVRTFSLQHQNSTPDGIAFRSAQPAIHALHEAILSEAGASPEVLDDGLNYLTAAVASAARVEAIVVDDEEIATFLRSVLVLGARGGDPAYDADREEQFARSPSWGSPSARIEAAQGLMDFLCWRRQEFEELRPRIEELARDPVAAVRFQIAGRLLYFNHSHGEWVGDQVRYFILEDPNPSLVHEALTAAFRMGSLSLEAKFDLAESVFERFNRATHEGGERLQSYAAGLIADLHVWHGYGRAQAWIGRHLDKPAPLHRDLISRFRDAVVCGRTDQPELSADMARGRALELYRSLTQKYCRSSQELWERLHSLSLDERSQEDIERIQDHFHTLDSIAMQLYFATGAHDARSGARQKPGLVHARLFVEAFDVFESLSSVPVPHVSHYLIETLEFLIECDPAEVFRLIANAVRSSEGQGYTAEPMAVDLFVRVIERYLADFREVFDDQERRKELLSCLNAFVKHGSPKVRQLIFRIPEIWQ
jgi:hypothetical protein